MRFLANENIPGIVVESLRKNGHDVDWIRESAPGVDDATVLRQATNERRILLTQDKDFGELAFRAGLSAECGVVLSRIPPDSPDFLCRSLVAALESREDWPGHFAVIESNRIRLRPLPGESPPISAP